jgi:hypothetical protein
LDPKTLPVFVAVRPARRANLEQHHNQGHKFASVDIAGAVERVKIAGKPERAGLAEALHERREVVIAEAECAVRVDERKLRVEDFPGGERALHGGCGVLLASPLF